MHLCVKESSGGPRARYCSTRGQLFPLAELVSGVRGSVRYTSHYRNFAESNGSSARLRLLPRECQALEICFYPKTTHFPEPKEDTVRDLIECVRVRDCDRYQSIGHTNMFIVDNTYSAVR